MTTYLGVQFAAPPTAALRWKSPLRPAPWNETRAATSHHWQGCPQFDFVKGIRIGNEDCLYLDVYVPDGCTAAAPCPVMQVRRSREAEKPKRRREEKRRRGRTCVVCCSVL